MRIRKNAKLSPLLFSSHASAPEALQTHVCQLNQSPWDVIPFPHQDSHNHQTEGEDSFTGNGSLGDSIGAVERKLSKVSCRRIVKFLVVIILYSSVASMMDMSEEKASVITVKAENMAIVEDDDDDDDNYTMKDCNSKVFDDNNVIDQRNLYCQKNDGKGWQCKKLPKPGHSFCEHHLSLVRSSYAAVSSSKKSASSSTRALNADAGTRRLRGRTKKGTSSTSNPYEYYYYSGFGPLWGRKRGGGGGDKGSESKVVVENSITSATNQTPSSTPSSSSQIDNEEFDYVDDDDVDDDEDGDDGSGGDSGKKRIRKPVKARSLKSLM
ncbi:hypothetical protein FNV43_RR15444 [Rhamnella rubrinervis]|uniref:WRC domain-containing protein n=1 Tax=Rhamnella rubrinervis TaxID=2594499 RepID=A0A8K0E1T8_9ROSA|nr:hypothetical protein FNV43_RR15444 [Rhamnella rubrinervis]